MLTPVTRRQVLVQLDDSQVESLDRIAEAFDESRSELIRDAIDLYVGGVREAVADVHYAEAYQRLPEDLQEFAGLRELALGAWPAD